LCPKKPGPLYIALRALDEHRSALPPLSEDVLHRVHNKLTREPVEDLRIDFEDGYGVRSAEEESAHAVDAANHIRTGRENSTLPRMLGIRIKPFAPATRHRSIHTLRTFFAALPDPPPHFTVTLPKVTFEEEVASLIDTLNNITHSHLPIELMIETPHALRNLPALLHAAQGRCRGAHFGPYDFTSACGLLSASQGLRHPLCTHARNEMLIHLSGTGVWLSDGPTSTLPVGKAAEISHAWNTQWGDIQHSLNTGFYQGWDLHPAQLPIRYAAVYTYFAEHLPAARARLNNFESQQLQATRVGTAFDDAATVLGLRAFLDRATACGAVDPHG